MKIRKGFVSNSSSSSFCIIIKKEDYAEALTKMSRIEKEALKFIKPTNKKAFGYDFKIVSYLSGNKSEFEDGNPDIELTDDEIDIIDNEGWECVLDTATNKLAKYEHICTAVDF